MIQEKNEFSYPVEVARIPTTAMKIELEASEKERAALAKRFGIPSVNSLKASVVLKALGGGRVRVTGSFDADVTELCVVSLDPFDERVRDSFSVLYSTGNEELSLKTNEIDFDADEKEEKDVIENGRIDVGELVAEYLSLALDPFPKRPGVEFSAYFEEDKAENPFSVLEKLKTK